MRDHIRLTGICGTGFHGVLPAERASGQPFVVDLSLLVDVRQAASSDDLADTIDYSTVAAHALAIIEGEPVDLIETLAERIASDVLIDARVEQVEVTVHKPEAPVGVAVTDVSVTVVRSR